MERRFERRLAATSAPGRLARGRSRSAVSLLRGRLGRAGAGSFPRDDFSGPSPCLPRRMLNFTPASTARLLIFTGGAILLLYFPSGWLPHRAGAVGCPA